MNGSPDQAQHLTILGSLLHGNFEYAQELSRSLVAEDRAEGLGVLVHRAFAHAVTRRFSSTWGVDDVVRYVAGLRTRLRAQGTDIDPLDLEALIRRALGDPILRHIGDEERAQAQLLVLLDLVAERVVGADEVLLAVQRADGVTIVWW